MKRRAVDTARPIPIVLALAITASILTVAATPAGADPQEPTNRCDGHWAIVSSPSPGNIGNALNDTASLSSTDAWAVGSQTSVDHAVMTTTTLIERWNGAEWSVVPSPQLEGGTLAGVYPVSPSDIWAVGSVFTGLTESVPLILHYDGATWQTYPSPQIQFANLLEVSGVSEVDIWAVGMVRSPVVHMLVEHFDGNRWSVQPTPSIDTGFVSLGGVAAVSAVDVWAVGSYLASNFFDASLSVHYDGTTWEIVPTPPPGREGSALYDVAAVSDHDVWAVGNTTGNAGMQPLAIRWDGSEWTIPAPAVGESGHLNGVVAGPGGRMLAVGSRTNSQGVARTLTERFDTQHWKGIPSPNASSSDNTLWSAAIVPGTAEAWAVGNFNPTTRGKTLVERICR